MGVVSCIFVSSLSLEFKTKLLRNKDHLVGVVKARGTSYFLFSKYDIVKARRLIKLSLIGDMLGGHLDDMEADWSKPIVSIRYCFRKML